MKPIYLFADSQFLFWQSVGRPFLKQIRNQLTPGLPKAACIGAAGGDLAAFYTLFRKAMRSIGVLDCRMIHDTYPSEDATFLKRADLILLAGGDSDREAEIFQNTCLRDAILDRYCEGAVLIGVAGGAVQLGLYTCVERGPQHQELLDACALVPFLIDTQHEEDDWFRLRQTMALMDECICGIGIPAGGGAIYRADGVLQPLRHFVDEFSVVSGTIQRTLLHPSPSLLATPRLQPAIAYPSDFERCDDLFSPYGTAIPLHPDQPQQHLEALSCNACSLIEAARAAAIKPHRRKILRRFSAAEILPFLGNMSRDTLYRRLKKDKGLPQGVKVKASRREFTLKELHHLQDAFGIAPRRPADKRPLVICHCKVNGGVAKTTTAHLAQYLCLQGYRVLAVDLDAQANLTQVLGTLAQKEASVGHGCCSVFDGPTQGEQPNPSWTGSLASAIQKTHWDQLDLIPSNLGLCAAEFAIALGIRSEDYCRFYQMLANALETVKDRYDIILLDTAPAPSLVNSNALYAADALVMTPPPVSYELESVVLEKLGTHLSTLYEVDPSDVSARSVSDRRTFERALAAMNDVNAEMMDAIRAFWQHEPALPRELAAAAAIAQLLHTAR